MHFYFFSFGCKKPEIVCRAAYLIEKKQKQSQSHTKGGKDPLVHTFITNITIQETTFLQIISHIFGNFGVKFLYRLLKYNTKRILCETSHPSFCISIFFFTCMVKVHSGKAWPKWTFIILRCIFWCLLEIIPVSFVHVLLLLFGVAGTQRHDQNPNFQPLKWTQIRFTK